MVVVVAVSGSFGGLGLGLGLETGLGWAGYAQKKLTALFEIWRANSGGFAGRGVH